MSANLTPLQNAAQAVAIVNLARQTIINSANQMNTVAKAATALTYPTFAGIVGNDVATALASSHNSLKSVLDTTIATLGLSNQQVNPQTGQPNGPATPIVIAAFPTA